MSIESVVSKLTNKQEELYTSIVKNVLNNSNLSMETRARIIYEVLKGLDMYDKVMNEHYLHVHKAINLID